MSSCLDNALEAYKKCFGEYPLDNPTAPDEVMIHDIESAIKTGVKIEGTGVDYIKKLDMIEAEYYKRFGHYPERLLSDSDPLEYCKAIESYLKKGIAFRSDIVREEGVFYD